MLKKLWPLGLIVVGVVLVLGSAAYGILLVGIPGPDDAPEQLARQDTQGSLAFGAFLLGCLVFLLGTVAAITKLALHWSRSKRSA